MPRFALRSLAAALLATLIVGSAVTAQETATATSLKSIVPTEAHMGLAWRRNPERDYQRKHLEAIVQTFKDEKIFERVVQMIKDRAPANDLAKAEEGLAEIGNALSPASLEALFNAEELIYAQAIEGQAVNHLLAVRITAEGAKGYLEAMRNLAKMAEKESNGQFNITEEEADGAQYLTLYPVMPLPMEPTIAVKDDVLIFSSSQPLAQSAVKNLSADNPTSKFDDPRIAGALAKLPTAEDSVSFYDGKLHLTNMKGQLEPVRAMLEQNAAENPEVGAGLRLMDAFFSEASVLDVEVAVEYTEEGKNHIDRLGVLLPGTEDKLLRHVIEGGKEFKDWQRWVPADALGYNINTGFNLHKVYTDALNIFSREAPEIAAQALMQLADFEEQSGFNLEDDLLMLFTGESVSVTLPEGKSVLAMRCPHPDRVRKLLTTLLTYAQAIPQAAAQQIELVESEDIEGFNELRAAFFPAVGAKPVIGFKEGWMIVGTTPGAAQKFLDTRWGDAPNVTSTEGFQRFGMKVGGPVRAISYSNTAEFVRGVAKRVNQGAAIAPFFLGAAMANADPEDMQTLQNALGLLPSIARVIEKFDFMEANLSVHTPGAQPGTYHKRGVMLIRQD